MSPEQVSRATDVLAVTELMARYGRAVDGLRFDRLADVYEETATVRYAWLPVGATESSSVDLTGRDEIITWLRSRLAGRPTLRRFMSGLEVLDRSPTTVVARLVMHERDMRITGSYRVEAVRTPAGLRIQRLDLDETIHHIDHSQL